MPFIKWTVEPVFLSRQPIPPDKSIGDELEATANLTLVATLRQLACLVSIANCIFTDIGSQCQTLNDRSQRLKCKVNHCEKLVSELNAKTVQVPVGNLSKFTSVKEHYKTSYSQDLGLFTPESRPKRIQELYNAAAITPVHMIRSFDKYRTDGRPGSRLFMCVPVWADEKHKDMDLEIETRRPSSATMTNVSNEILKLPSPEEKMHALSMEYPSVVLPIDTSGKPFNRMSAVRRSLIHVDFLIKRRKYKKRRNTISNVNSKELHEALSKSSDDRTVIHTSCQTDNVLPAGSCQHIIQDEKRTLSNKSSADDNIKNTGKCSSFYEAVKLNKEWKFLKRTHKSNQDNVNKGQLFKSENFKGSGKSFLPISTNCSAITVAVKLRENSARSSGKTHEEGQSSSGNWSASSSTRASVDSDNHTSTFSPDTVDSHSDNSLGKDSVLSDNGHHDTEGRANDGTLTGYTSDASGAQINTTLPSSWRLSSKRSQQLPGSRKVMSKDQDSSSGTYTPETCLSDSNGTSSTSPFPPKHNSNSDSFTLCMDDGESSVYSVDTDGYYTSMHTDSGLNTKMGKFVKGQEVNFTINEKTGSQSSLDTIGNISLNSFLSQTATDTASNSSTLNGNFKVPPVPPPRVSSVKPLSVSSQTEINFSDSPPFAGEVFESDIEVGESLKTKTIINSLRYPSICAVSPEPSDDECWKMDKSDKYFFPTQKVPKTSPGIFPSGENSDKVHLPDSTSKITSGSNDRENITNVPLLVNMYSDQITPKFSLNILSSSEVLSSESGIPVTFLGSFDPSAKSKSSSREHLTELTETQFVSQSIDTSFLGETFKSAAVSPYVSSTLLNPLTMETLDLTKKDTRAYQQLSVSSVHSKCPVSTNAKKLFHTCNAVGLRHPVSTGVTCSKDCTGSCASHLHLLDNRADDPYQNGNLTPDGEHKNVGLPDSTVLNCPAPSSVTNERKQNTMTGWTSKSGAHVVLDPEGKVVYSSNSLGRRRDDHPLNYLPQQFSSPTALSQDQKYATLPPAKSPNVRRSSGAYVKLDPSGNVKAFACSTLLKTGVSGNSSEENEKTFEENFNAPKISAHILKDSPETAELEKTFTELFKKYDIGNLNKQTMVNIPESNLASEVPPKKGSVHHAEVSLKMLPYLPPFSYDFCSSDISGSLNQNMPEGNTPVKNQLHQKDTSILPEKIAFQKHSYCISKVPSCKRTNGLRSPSVISGRTIPMQSHPRHLNEILAHSLHSGDNQSSSCNYQSVVTTVPAQIFKTGTDYNLCSEQSKPAQKSFQSLSYASQNSKQLNQNSQESKRYSLPEQQSNKTYSALPHHKQNVLVSYNASPNTVQCSSVLRSTTEMKISCSTEDNKHDCLSLNQEHSAYFCSSPDGLISKELSAERVENGKSSLPIINKSILQPLKFQSEKGQSSVGENYPYLQRTLASQNVSLLCSSGDIETCSESNAEIQNARENCNFQIVYSLSENSQTAVKKKVKKPMSTEDLFAAIHSSKKKHNIKTEFDIAQSPFSSRSNSPSVGRPSTPNKGKVVESGFLSPRGLKAHDRRSWAGELKTQMFSSTERRSLANDRLGPVKPTSIYDFKKLLLHARSSSQVGKKRVSAAELLKASSPIKSTENVDAHSLPASPIHSPTAVQCPDAWLSTVPIKRGGKVKSSMQFRYGFLYPPILEDCSEESSDGKLTNFQPANENVHLQPFLLPTATVCNGLSHKPPESTWV